MDKTPLNYAYILKCADGTFYCGWTNDLSRRLAAHNAGTGSRYTRSRRPVVLAYQEAFETPREARSREWHLKRLTHKQKEALIFSGASHPSQPESEESQT